MNKQKYHLLITPKMYPLPKTITILFETEITIVIQGDFFDRIKGKNALVVATPKDMEEFLKKFESFWAGSGSPQLEQFMLINRNETDNIKYFLRNGKFRYQ